MVLLPGSPGVSAGIVSKANLFDQPASFHAAGNTNSARNPPIGAVESVRLPP